MACSRQLASPGQPASRMGCQPGLPLEGLLRNLLGLPAPPHLPSLRVAPASLHCSGTPWAPHIRPSLFELHLLLGSKLRPIRGGPRWPGLPGGCLDVVDPLLPGVSAPTPLAPSSPPLLTSGAPSLGFLTPPSTLLCTQSPLATGGCYSDGATSLPSGAHPGLGGPRRPPAFFSPPPTPGMSPSAGRLLCRAHPVPLPWSIPVALSSVCGPARGWRLPPGQLTVPFPWGGVSTAIVTALWVPWVNSSGSVLILCFCLVDNCCLPHQTGCPSVLCGVAPQSHTVQGLSQPRPRGRGWRGREGSGIQREMLGGWADEWFMANVSGDPELGHSGVHLCHRKCHFQG